MRSSDAAMEGWLDRIAIIDTARTAILEFGVAALLLLVNGILLVVPDYKERSVAFA